MTTIYVDASSWGKLLKEEPESSSFSTFADRALDAGDEFVSSSLLVTDVLRMAQRYRIDRIRALSVLAQVNIVLPEVSLYRAAGLLSGDTLRTLDAIHVAHCLDIGAEVMFPTTHDRSRRPRRPASQLCRPDDSCGARPAARHRTHRI